MLNSLSEMRLTKRSKSPFRNTMDNEYVDLKDQIMNRSKSRSRKQLRGRKTAICQTDSQYVETELLLEKEISKFNKRMQKSARQLQKKVKKHLNRSISASKRKLKSQLRKSILQYQKSGQKKMGNFKEMILTGRNLNEDGVLFSSRLKLSKNTLKKRKKQKSSSPRRRKDKILRDAPFGFTQDGNIFPAQMDFSKKGKLKKSKLIKEMSKIKKLKDLKNSNLLNSKIAKRLKNKIQDQKKVEKTQKSI